MKKSHILSCSFAVFAVTMFFGINTASAQPGRTPARPTSPAPQKVVVVSPKAQQVKPPQGPTKVIVSPQGSNHKPLVINTHKNNDPRNSHQDRFDPRKNDNRWDPKHNNNKNHDPHHSHNHNNNRNHNNNHNHNHGHVTHVPVPTPSPVPIHVPVPVSAKEPSFRLKIGSLGITIK